MYPYSARIKNIEATERAKDEFERRNAEARPVYAPFFSFFPWSSLFPQSEKTPDVDLLPGNAALRKRQDAAAQPAGDEATDAKVLERFRKRMASQTGRNGPRR